MPFINVKLAGRPVSDAQRQALVAGLTERVHLLLGKRKDVTAVTVEELPARNWSIGGQTVTAAAMTAYVDIKITRGTNSTEQKAAMIAAATVFLREVLGDMAEASYVVIHELNGDSWGYDGIAQQARMARKAGASVL